jgi:hypothetical protein
MCKGFAVGHMIAMGPSGKGVARLAKVIDAYALTPFTRTQGRPAHGKSSWRM